jgi:hypothetical protein
MLKVDVQVLSFVFILPFPSCIYDLTVNERLFGVGLSKGDRFVAASPRLKEPLSRRELSKPPKVRLANTLFDPTVQVSMHPSLGFVFTDDCMIPPYSSKLFPVLSLGHYPVDFE